MSALRGIVYSYLRPSFAVSVRHEGSQAALQTTRGPLVSFDMFPTSGVYVLSRYNVSCQNATSYRRL